MEIHIPVSVKEPNPLPMGGLDSDGNRHGVNTRFLTRNGTATLPVMGEIHFSRVNETEWREALAKMRAGGIGVIATYVFWIHHEERIGEWNFCGQRNLRNFLLICNEMRLPVWLRVGPWCHGECRNGGFPDWLVADKSIVVRTNDPNYLLHVARYFDQLAKQCSGLTAKDGGPVLGIQIENEYGHAGGPRDSTMGFAHLCTLKDMLISRGMTVPYYTATAWGNAYVLFGETLPVQGGYVDEPWAGHSDELPASRNFLFKLHHSDLASGSEQKMLKYEGMDDPAADHPFLTSELGGGLQVTARRRTYPWAEDIFAQALCMLGSGANLLGYYMFHGGTNPEGEYSTLQESVATGSPNDHPVMSYDFQACIRENGQLSESFHRLRALHLLIQDFGALIAPSVPVFVSQPETPEDLETPRVSVRHNFQAGCGFVFINNHQRKRAMKPVENLCLSLSGGYQADLRGIRVPGSAGAILPYGLKLPGGTLEWTNATLLCQLGGRTFFYTDEEAVYVMREGRADIITLSSAQAFRTWRFGQKIYITDAALHELDGVLYALSVRETETMTIFSSAGQSETVTLSFPIQKEPTVLTAKGEAAYTITIDEVPPCHEAYLSLPFIGDRAEVYLGNRMVADWFQTGETWQLPLKRFGFPKVLTVKVYPSRGGVYYDLPHQTGCRLDTPRVSLEQRLEIRSECSMSDYKGHFVENRSDNTAAHQRRGCDEI